MGEPRPFRTLYASGTPWEPRVGYSRAVRAGDEIFVSGTTATDPEGRIVGGADVFAQTRQALANVRRAVEALGGEITDVVRTRIYVKDIRSWEAVARAHHELFGEVRPATMMVEVSRFIDEAMLVEVEADARVPPERAQRSGSGSSPA